VQVVLQVVGDAGAAVPVVHGEVGELGVALQVRQSRAPVLIQVMRPGANPKTSKFKTTTPVVDVIITIFCDSLRFSTIFGEKIGVFSQKTML
jgi:hypothetical protein